MATCHTEITRVQERLRQAQTELSKQRRRASQAARDAHARASVQTLLAEKVAVCLLHLHENDATVAVRFLLAQPHMRDNVASSTAAAVHTWDEQRRATGQEDPLEPVSPLGLKALHMAAAFCREDQLFSWVRQQNIEKGLAPSNAALWRQHTAPPVPGTRARAPAAAANATTLRTRNQWILRWSRRWNVRRGFFKAGERVPVETRQAKAEFRSCTKQF